MADRPATVHWQIAERILWHVRAGATNEEAVVEAASEYPTVSLNPEDVTKIANALDELSAQYQPAGYWYGLVWDGFIRSLQRGIAVEAGFRMPGWGWALLIVGIGFVLYSMRRRGGIP